MINALLVPVEGEAQPLHLDLDLDALYRLLGCRSVKVVSGPGWTAYLDEEGKLGPNWTERVNVGASLAAQVGGWPLGDVLVGPVLFVGPPDREGLDTSLPAGVHQMVLRVLWALAAEGAS